MGITKIVKIIISIFIIQLKPILSEKKLNKLGKEKEFTRRERNITAFQLVTAMILIFFLLISTLYI